MNYEEARGYVNQYCRLRDMQFAAYESYARKRNLTAKELFVLDLIWFAENGCLQSEICERLSATKQTVSAIVKKFLKKGYVTLTESETDRRNKIIRLTRAGKNTTRYLRVRRRCGNRSDGRIAGRGYRRAGAADGYVFALHEKEIRRDIGVIR